MRRRHKVEQSRAFRRDMGGRPTGAVKHENVAVAKRAEQAGFVLQMLAAARGIVLLVRPQLAGDGLVRHLKRNALL